MARQNDHNRAEALISAYLDKRVSAEEQDFFERHIASCANCRAQLEATRSMVAALRAMPVVKAPRSFVLPREIAKQPKRSLFSLYPALRLATVVAAMAFVVLFARDLLINQSGGGSASPSIPAAAPASAVARAPEALRQIAPTAAPAADTFNQAAPAPAEQPAATAAGAAKTGATAALTESTALSAATATPEVTMSAKAALQAKSAVTATPESTESASGLQAAPAAEQPTAANRTGTTSAIDPLRVVEVALLVLAVLLGIATLVARRQ